MFKHEYSYHAKDYLQLKYPNQLKIVKGNSTETLPNHTGIYDFIYVDGNHSYEIARQDLKNIVKNTNKDTVVIIDDYVVEQKFIRSHNKGVKRALTEFNEFQVLGQEDFGIGRGMIWGLIQH